MNKLDSLLYEVRRSIPERITFTDTDGVCRSMILVEFVLLYTRIVLVDDGALIADSSVAEVLEQLRPITDGTIYRDLIDDIQERRGVIPIV